MESWPAYLNYSGNLGIQTLTDILYTHYGPNPASQELNGYGQWTRADSTSVGMDRTVSSSCKASGRICSILIGRKGIQWYGVQRPVPATGVRDVREHRYHARRSTVMVPPCQLDACLEGRQDRHPALL